MNNNEYLNEEKYQKTKNKIKVILVIAFLIGISIGGFLLYKGLGNSAESKIEKLEKELKTQKKELEDKGVQYDSLAKYTDGEVYDLKIITNALDPSFDHCAFDEYKNNSITRKYCSLKNANGDFARTGYIMFGGFIIFVTCIICGTNFVALTKGREVMAFHTQQAMPIVKETAEEIAPTIGKASSTIAKEMAPVYGDIARKITKVIKEGRKDDEK